MRGWAGRGQGFQKEVELQGVMGGWASWRRGSKKACRRGLIENRGWKLRLLRQERQRQRERTSQSEPSTMASQAAGRPAEALGAREQQTPVKGPRRPTQDLGSKQLALRSKCGLGWPHPILACAQGSAEP